MGGLYVLYLVAGNVLVNSSRARAELNRKPQTIQVQWSWAWTAWPGQIDVHGLRLHGHARQLLWSAQGERAWGRVRLWPLFRRELRFAPIRAYAVAVDVQPTVADRKPPPWRSDAWRVTFDGIRTSSLRRVRLGDLVAEGHGEGEVGFTHQLRGGPTRVFPSRVAMSDARLDYRQQPLLRRADVDLRFAVDAFTHERPAGWRKAERASGRLSVAGDTPPFMPRPARAASAGQGMAAGRLKLDIPFDHGSLLPGGSVQWDGPMASLETDGTLRPHRAHAGLEMGPDAVTLRAQVAPAAGGAGTTAQDGGELRLRFASRRLLPLRPFADAVKLLSGTARFRWHFASLDWLTPLLLSKPWLHLDGAGEVAGSLRLEAGTLMPGSRVEVPEVALGARILGKLFTGKAHALASVDDAPAGGSLAMSLSADRFALAPDAASTPYLRGRGLRLDMQSSRDLARFRDAFAARLRFTDADVPDLRAYNPYLPGRSLNFLSGRGRMSTDIRIDGKGDVNAGRMQVSSSGAWLAVGPSRLFGNLHMDTRLTASRRAGHAYDLDRLTLMLDGIRVAGSRDPPWWARFTIRHGRLDWDRPMRLRGNATMVMKDVSLLLSLFAERNAFPKWIARVIDDGQATAHAEVDARRGDFVLDRLSASNKRVDLSAHLRVRDGIPDGALYVRWGVLGLGVGLSGGQRDFHLLHAARWYRSQPDLLSPADEP
ncbi:hypothetical protein ASG87_06460 [Frateuria sp. Soil773]|nr:hypothetical protein ASG87_06460 [Frateuria sp. Soil773]